MPDRFLVSDLASKLRDNPGLAEKVIELSEQGLDRSEILDWLKVHWSECFTFEADYLNDFHKNWNEACVKENESKRSMHFSVEFLKAQSLRLEDQLEQDEHSVST